jgi:LysM repeat protein
MGFEFSKLFYPHKPEKENNNKPAEEADKKGITRRKFLELAGAGLITVALGPKLLELLDYYCSDEKEHRKGGPESSEFNDTEEFIDEDVKSMSEILKFNQPGRIKIKPETLLNDLKNYRKNQYMKDPDFIRGNFEIGYWEDYSRYIFGKVYDDDKKFSAVADRAFFVNLFYLAIPESNFKLFAKSPVGAQGPYQFMKKTAQSYNLQINHSIDERNDPLKSAWACARLLKDLYMATRDWDLALSGYNGGYIWEYLKVAKNSREKPSYAAFCTFMEGKINHTREEIMNSSSLDYKVRAKNNPNNKQKKSASVFATRLKLISSKDRKGDSPETIKEIAKKHGISIDQLCSINGFTSGQALKVGMQIKIPLNSKTKEKVFLKKVAGFKENLEYPARFYAATELIDEGFITKKASRLDYKVIRAGTFSGNYVYQTDGYVDPKHLATHYKVSVDDILRANPWLGAIRTNASFIEEGGLRDIYIPVKNVTPTLRNYAKKYGMKPNEIWYLNPSIRDVDMLIPEGYEVRVREQKSIY